jgi:nickel-type superoxide dismutase maturation protease
MLPTLSEGQLIVAHQIRNFKEGQVVVAYVNGLEVIKRISKIDNGSVFLQGDNKEHSTDSRTYGPIPDSNIEGVVFWPKTYVKL